MIVLGYVLEWALRRELGENAKVEGLETRRLMFMLLFDLCANQKEKGNPLSATVQKKREAAQQQRSSSSIISPLGEPVGAV